ncbi:class I SAM-dependent methyltransferase [Motilibacter deserti]|uniref:Class I SAM-dependent methyltransferase n=1 Tax=Motilibacter deserti TaxID=2714956 RepID=A0ABX0GZS3_9ACTN|nr:class I SAM-dependent methyltransferase [Motilibacter deserti]NHC15166.1 class I SAM-dependent methyltransferase [Motilibacter deserti]
MAGQMPYLEFLGRLHEALRPATYLEVGVRAGDSLALSRSKSIGIDPDFAIKCPITCDVALFKTTSDEYFSRPDPLAPFHGAPADLAFIDGMHLFEFALRDFINVERCSSPSSVVVFDDIFPRKVDEAARDRHTRVWTGDVYKIVEVLRQYRPDLTLLLVDTGPTGLLLVTGLDPDNTVLTDHYDEIVEKYVVDDPQDVPPAILNREGALAPEKLLRSPVWGSLRRSRRPWVSRERARVEMTEALERPTIYRARRRELRRTATRTVKQGLRQVKALRSR